MKSSEIHNLAADLEQWVMAWETFAEDVESLQIHVEDWEEDPDDFQAAESAAMLRDELEARFCELDKQRQHLSKRMDRLALEMGARWNDRDNEVPHALLDYYEEIAG